MGTKLYIKTYGCQMNEYDSQKTLEILKKDSTIEETNTPDNNKEASSVRTPATRKLDCKSGRFGSLTPNDVPADAPPPSRGRAPKMEYVSSPIEASTIAKFGSANTASQISTGLLPNDWSHSDNGNAPDSMKLFGISRNEA